MRERDRNYIPPLVSSPKCRKSFRKTPGRSLNLGERNRSVSDHCRSGAVRAVGWTLLLCIACSDSGPPDPDPDPEKNSVEISPAGRPVLVGSSVDFTATVVDPDSVPIFFDSIVWTVTNPALATVDSFGVAFFSALGTTGVIAAAGDVSDTVTVTVHAVDWARLDAGRGPTCGLTTTGQAYCWGYGGRGAVGDGQFIDQQIPTAVGGGLTFSTIETGGWMSCGLTTAGAAYCWGEEGGVGFVNSSVPDTALPAAVSGGLVFTSLTVGGLHSCGLNAAGAAYCWGYGISGQLGDGGFVSSRDPVPVSGNLVFTELSAGWEHTCGVTVNGQAYCWGNNTHGMLGTGDKITVALPAQVASPDSFIAISAGAVHSCGIVAGGAAVCWGANHDGQMGTGSADSGSTTPVPVAGGLNFMQVSAAIVDDHFTCGVTTGGDGYCWGQNSSGHLGDGSTTARTSPSLVAGSITFSSITTGWLHGCGTATDGRSYCWGNDSFGAMGNGRPDTGSPVPVQVPGKP